MGLSQRPTRVSLCLPSRSVEPLNESRGLGSPNRRINCWVDMDYDYALAFALSNKALCLFAGAGVSKHLTANAMPDWRQLLEETALSLNAAEKVKAQLDQARETAFPLEDCAQILELAFLREGLEFRKTVADIIAKRQADPKASAAMKSFLEAHPGVDVMTTNYDLLIESLLPAKYNSNYPGKPISRRDNCVDVFHVHGCILNPSGMVVTTNDYYRFINGGGYFAQKLSTMLHENSTIIVGYSLGDPNLKAILNDYRASGVRAINRGNHCYVTRGVVPSHIRDYYEAAYGIAVIENTEVDDLLRGIQEKFPEAQRQTENADEYLRSVLYSKHFWTDDYLKLRASLFHIVATANTNGHDVHSDEFTKMLAAMLDKKVDFTRESGAWEQYSHLADWVVYLGSIMDMSGTPLETPFLLAAEHSMRTMTKSYTLGSSWAAFKTWKSAWPSLTFKNRMLVRALVEEKQLGADAFEVVSQGGA